MVGVCQHCGGRLHLEQGYSAEEGWWSELSCISCGRADAPAQRPSSVPSCGNGHELTDANVYVAPDGRTRRCRACMVQNQRDYIARRKAAVHAG